MVNIVNKDSMTVPDSQGFIGHKHTSEWPTLVYSIIFYIERGGDKDLESYRKVVETVTEFKEFERQFKFKPRFKYGWFHLKLYQMF